ncbi:MAG: hypothetical protein ACI8QC_000420 [Planctomycetota bacterium]|jgi:uncharacterized protein YbjQ (UPF0145 family)
MIIVTTEQIPGREVVDTCGLVRGTTVRSRHMGLAIRAMMRILVGGEIVEYTKLLAECREQAIDRMTDEAHSMGADAIVGFRFVTMEVARGAAEIVAYGTAVTLVPK